MQKLFVIRHGITDWNVQGLTQGTQDIPLNEEGIRQAKELAKKIDLNNIDLCICSPMRRTKETAKIILKDSNLKVVYNDLLVERNFGLYEGKKISIDLLFRQWDYKLNDKVGDIECITSLLERANKFLKEIREKYPNQNILIISHGCFIKALHYNINGYSENTDFLSFNPKNATLYEYVF